MSRRDAAARKRERERINLAAKAVKQWMRTPEAKKIHATLEAAHLLEADLVASRIHWRPTIYSRGRYPQYHVRKGGELGVSCIRDPRLAALISALFNAYEAISGKDVLDLCRM